MGTSISMSISVHTTKRVWLNSPTFAAEICWWHSCAGGRERLVSKGKARSGAEARG
jgi:hypothetical protein